MIRKTHHVLPEKSGNWVIKKGGSYRASKYFDTKRDAINWGRTVSRNQKTEFIIHNKDGKIQKADSHGNDPYPLKDRR